MIELETVAVAAVVVFFAAALQSVSGFGFALVLVPLLSLLWDVKATVVVSSLLSTASLLPLVWRSRGSVDLGRLRPMLVGSAGGVPVGVLLLTKVSSDALQVAVGGTVIVATLIVLAAPAPGPKSSTLFAPVAAGAAAGLLRGATSMGGPPAILYLLANERNPAALRGTMSWFLLPQGLFAIIALGIAGRISEEVLVVAAATLPTLVSGLLVGAIVAPRVNAAAFRLLACFILLSTSVAAMVAVLF